MGRKLDKYDNPDGSGWYARNGKTYDIPPWTPEVPVLPENPLDAVPELKAHAIHVWDSLAMVFGSCRQLVELGWISAADHRSLGDWLRHLEALVRRIVMIAALAYAHLKPARSKGPWSTDAWRQRELWHDPTSWRVSFSILPGRRQARAGSRRYQNLSPTRRALPMARRIEAIRRVLSYIPGYAKRFARRMQRLRARNATANQKQRIHLPSWDFHPHRRTEGKWAVDTGMVKACPLSEIALDRMLIEPG